MVPQEAGPGVQMGLSAMSPLAHFLGDLDCPVLPQQHGPLAAHMTLPWHGNCA